MRSVVRSSGLLRLFGRLESLESLAPPAELPFFFGQIGKTFPAEGEQRYRVAFLAGCIANVSFARLNEATVRVLKRCVPSAVPGIFALTPHNWMLADLRRDYKAMSGMVFGPIPTVDAVVTAIAELERRLNVGT